MNLSFLDKTPQEIQAMLSTIKQEDLNRAVVELEKIIQLEASADFANIGFWLKTLNDEETGIRQIDFGGKILSLETVVAQMPTLVSCLLWTNKPRILELYHYKLPSGIFLSDDYDFSGMSEEEYDAFVLDYVKTKTKWEKVEEQFNSIYDIIYYIGCMDLKEEYRYPQLRRLLWMLLAEKFDIEDREYGALTELYCEDDGFCIEYWPMLKEDLGTLIGEDFEILALCAQDAVEIGVDDSFGVLIERKGKV